VITWPSYSR